MTNDTSCKGKRSCLILLASLAVNIFLVAFLLGRTCMSHDMHGGPHPMPPFAENGEHHAPPFFGPSELFTPQEMHSNFEEMKPQFEEVHALREAFAKKLQSGTVTKDEVLAHFAEMDAKMDAIKKHTQDKAADKISSLTPEERAKFAQHLLDKNAQEPAEPPHGDVRPAPQN